MPNWEYTENPSDTGMKYLGVVAQKKDDSKHSAALSPRQNQNSLRHRMLQNLNRMLIHTA